ncbi:phosphoinositide 3-kinase regulatory subunit 5-like [Brachionichthys hirsutus]|uniref:phosphoinositide 3-kinase regulatory subunit 5-like n=1 Tax=Brachionichthys hirsutus TaxID=412623 RepID=UPI0036045524
MAEAQLALRLPLLSVHSGTPPPTSVPKMEQSSCTEDRIQHVLERCLCDLGLGCPDKKVWNAGLCINRWCLEELVKRDPHNFLILLQKILRKTKQVAEQCRYELVVPLTLLFSSTLLTAPHVAPDCEVLQEAYVLFHGFLAWPEPCCSASKRLLKILQQELRAPGISFQRLVRSEQSVSPAINSGRTITVLLLSSDDGVPPEVQNISEQLSSARRSSRDIAVTLILHGLQAALGTELDPRALRTVLQAKSPEELEQLTEAVAVHMETAALTADLKSARQGLTRSMERLRESLGAPVPADGGPDAGAVENFMPPLPKCHTCSWKSNDFDFLNDILTNESDLNSPADCFHKTGLDGDDNETSVDEEDDVEGNKLGDDIQSHRISTASSSSRDSSYSFSSSWSVVSTPSGSSGVESDFSEDITPEDTEEGPDRQPKPRKKPKKKSQSFLGYLLFKTPGSPDFCRRVQSVGSQGDVSKDLQGSRSELKHSRSLCRQTPPLQAPSDPCPPEKYVCIRRKPILSCDEDDVVAVPTLVKLVVFGGDREVGRLARAYCDLQQKESQCPQLTKTCKLQFYFVPVKRTTVGGQQAGHTRTGKQMAGSNKAAVSGEPNGVMLEDSTTDIAHLLGAADPWYERNVLSLLSLSSLVLCQMAGGRDCGDVSSGSMDRVSLLADLVLYYCRHAERPVLVQLYQAELTLAGGERRKEVFIHSLELGHTAGARAVKAMGSASKRFGIEGEREAVPLTLSVAYNKVAVSGRSQWIQTDTVCTSVNLHKACRMPELQHSRTESLQLIMKEVLKRQSSKSKKSFNQHIAMTEARVDRVQVHSSGEDGAAFSVCLDQDEKKFIQSVTRCAVSPCCKPGTSSDWNSFKSLPGQVRPLHPSYCSLLCLPIFSFSA